MPIQPINKNGSTTYDVYVSAYNPTTGLRHHRRRRAKTKSQAKSLEASLLIELRESFSKPKVTTWEELLREYENETLVYKAASTQHNERSLIGHHGTPRLKGKQLKDVTTTDVRDILDRVQNTRSLSLQHNVKKCLSNLFNYAVQRKYIQENPCSYIKLQKMPEPVLSILTQKQITDFLAAAEASGIEWFPIWATAVYTGMRSGELYALRYKHLQHDDGKPVIKVQESWTKQGGFKPYTKNRMVRSVPINPELQRILDTLRAQNPNSGDPEEFVLPRISSWGQGDAAKDLGAFLDGCGLPKIRFHDLRACFISQMLLNKVPPSMVMKIVGHHDMKTMMRYCRHTGSDLLGLTDILNFSKNNP